MAFLEAAESGGFESRREQPLSTEYRICGTRLSGAQDDLLRFATYTFLDEEFKDDVNDVKQLAQRILRVVASYPEVVAERAVDLWMDRSVPRLCARTRRSSRIQVVLCHIACLPKAPTKPTAASTRSTCLAGECICPEIDQEGDRNLGTSGWGNDTMTHIRKIFLFFC